MKVLFYTCIFFCLDEGMNGSAQSSLAVNYLNTSSEISFNGTKFRLAWSSHPTVQYYKQEYFPAGQSPEKFTDMFLLEVVTSSLTPKDAFDAKLAELKALKQSNPYISFETFHQAQTDEYLLDFIITANAADGKTIQIAERNVYRYKKFTGAKGETGVVLMGVSKRSYAEAASAFVKGLTAETKKDLADKVKRFAFPSMRMQAN